MLLVTGITGHSGKWFFERLEKENYRGKVRFLVHERDHSFMDNSKLDLEKVHGDISDLEFLVESMKGIKTVLHIASIIKTENIIEAAIRNKVKWVICVHTTGRFSKYKSASEEYIRIEDGVLKRRNEIDITIVRPTMIYGSSQDKNMYNLVDFLYSHRLFPMFGKGENLMQPVLARDLGNAYYDIIANSEKTKNKEYDLSGKEPIEYNEIIKTVSRILSKDTLIVKLPIWFSIIAARIYNLISKNPRISVEQVLRMQEDKAFDHSQAEKDFGYSPQPFNQGIKLEIEEYLLKNGT